jgi:hypothetical protein
MALMNHECESHDYKVFWYGGASGRSTCLEELRNLRANFL